MKAREFLGGFNEHLGNLNKDVIRITTLQTNEIDHSFSYLLQGSRQLDELESSLNWELNFISGVRFSRTKMIVLIYTFNSNPVFVLFLLPVLVMERHLENAESSSKKVGS